MKKLTPLLLTLLLTACSTPVEEVPLTQLPSATEESADVIQTHEYTTEAGKTYTVTFNSTTLIETTSGTTYHDFEIQGTSVFPGTLTVTSHKVTPDQTPHELVDLYFDPTHPKAEVTPVQMGENLVYLFEAPEFSSATTEFAVIMLGGESLLFMFQSAGPDQLSIDADRAVFMEFLSSLQIN